MFSSRALPGIGAAILAWLEEAARQLGYREIWLETRVVNAKAVGFYLKQGYVKIPNYGVYVGREEAVCFAKRLRVWSMAASECQNGVVVGKRLAQAVGCQ
jgi:RimJ/RimL family protein N-acetyltransferase